MTSPLNPSSGDRLGVEQADVYQMLAYGHTYTAEGRPVRLVLLYPHRGGLDPPGILRRWAVRGASTPLEVATLDVAEHSPPAAVGSRLAELLRTQPPPLSHPA